MERYNAIQRMYGKEAFNKIYSSKVLVIGAGGIGCEILKNLALTGFHHIELIDLDTIDISNLNRQFLFRSYHVGKSKSLIASNEIKKFNNDLIIKSYHDNIKNIKFNLNFIKNFHIIFNALDNIDARRHVNRLCLATNVLLIDSGTTGYLGQVTPIIKNQTACYECFPKPTPKVFPICTIRSTPDKPVHCIVWAKEYFKLLFGNTTESMLYEDETIDESTYMKDIHYPSIPTVVMNHHKSHDPSSRDGEDPGIKNKIEQILLYGKQLLVTMFHLEIKKRLQMETYKTAIIIPEPLSIEMIEIAINETKEILLNNRKDLIPSYKSGWDQRIFTQHENLIEFLCCLYDIDSTLIGQFQFDKDDLWAMKFISAATNLRCSIFSIPLLSFHDAKGIAGNIIPAIATTNAIVAGIQVMQAIRLILSSFNNHQNTEQQYDAEQQHDADAEQQQQQHNMEKVDLGKVCPHVYVLRNPTRKGMYLQPSTADPPQKSCFVCGKAQLTLQIDVTESTLNDLINNIIKKKLGFNEPSLMVGGSILYEEGEDCDEDLHENLPLKLQDCPAGGIIDGSLLSIDDFSQQAEVQIVIKHVNKEELEKDETIGIDLFIISGKEIFEKQQEEIKLKRHREENNEEENQKKRKKVDNDENIMILDE